MYKRIFLLVLDSVGIGEAPDAKQYNDLGADTVGNIALSRQGIHLPTMDSLGFANLKSRFGAKAVEKPLGLYTKMLEASIGKDTMTGHWELMGLHIDKAFKTFPDGFPFEMLDELAMKTGRTILRNIAASGTEIIEQSGQLQMETGGLIVYTSADSVLQIAAHEDVVPLEELYEICQLARELTMDERYLVGRVIARPFIGKPGAFVRTANRRDYALKPYGETVLNFLKAADYDVISLGKIVDIFDGEGITKAIRTTSNTDGMEKLASMLAEEFTGLCFLNLVDFDAEYGHRRDPEGYGQALETFDQQLEAILPMLREDDLLILTADHGNDPTFTGTDHTREIVPLLIYNKDLEQTGPFEERQTFADVGATIADNFTCQMPEHGISFLHNLKRKQ